MTYSGAFAELIADEGRVKTLLAGSSFYNADFRRWSALRRGVAEVIERDGSVLDVGCGNGFLLRCLQEWSGHELVPYGVDVNASLIADARSLFPKQVGHFLAFDLRRLPGLGAFPDLPTRFAYVYWCVWDSWKFQQQQERDVLESLAALVADGGRLILGFYHEDRGESYEVISNLEGLGLNFSGIIENQGGSGVIVWQDRRAPAGTQGQTSCEN